MMQRGGNDSGAPSGPGGPGSDIVAFGQKLLSLLDQGATSTSYKYAVLLALIDCCMEGAGSDGLAPTSVTTAQLADKVLVQYWRQALPYGDGSGAVVLRQSGTGQAEIVSLIRTYLSRRSDVYPTLARCDADDPAGMATLRSDIEWKLIEMPLPRLQTFGANSDRFIYEINWDQNVSRRTVRSDDFDNRVLLVGRSGDALIRLGPLLRPLIQRKWAAMVAGLNRSVIPERHLDDFLFGAPREANGTLQSPLRDLQNNRCFYCDGPMPRTVEIDHFLPWARYPDDGVANLVAAHGHCNSNKRDFLAAAPHVDRWRLRLDAHAADLRTIAQECRRTHHPAKTLSVARVIYLALPPDTKLWAGVNTFVGADVAALRAHLA